MSQEVLYICVYNVQIKWTTLFVKEADNLEKSSTFCEISKKNTFTHFTNPQWPFNLFNTFIDFLIVYGLIVSSRSRRYDILSSARLIDRIPCLHTLSIPI